MILKENSASFNTSFDIDDDESKIARTELQYQNFSAKFKYSSKDFNKQYFHIYTVRLNSMSSRILKVVENKWGNIAVRTLGDLADEEYNQCVVTGTLYKNQQLKPSVLKEISEEHQLVPQPPATHYTSAEDALVLEDETQRIRLTGNLPTQTMVTGIVIAVKGTKNESGCFEVNEYCFADVEYVPFGIPPIANDCYIALVSGLELSKNCDLLSAQQLVDWLTGVSGGSRDHEMSARVVRVLLAGGLLGVNKDPAEAESSLVEGVKLLDQFCFQLVGSVPTDVMPGDTDPSNHNLPQQPFHPCILGQSARMRSCLLACNPHYCAVGDKRVLGHSGQPIADMAKVTDNVDPLGLLRSSLEWGHLAPTAPDTLACYPYYENDPFIIEEQPDILFAGNQPSFQTDLVNCPSGSPCRLVCVPTFSSTRTIVLVNLRTLDCTPLTFSHPSY